MPGLAELPQAEAFWWDHWRDIVTGANGMGFEPRLPGFKSLKSEVIHQGLLPLL